MRPLALILALSLALAATSAAGDVKVFGRVGIQSGGSGAVLSIGPTPMPHTKPPFAQTTPPGAAALERGRLRKRALPDEPVKRHPRRRHRRPFFVFPHIHEHRAPETVVIETPAPPPPEAVPAEPPSPPDPRGPLILPARGAAMAAPYTVGEPLPAGLPHVALDWRQHGLPEPPPGLAYARVGRDVLLIDPATRMVERRLEPDALAAGEG